MHQDRSLVLRFQCWVWIQTCHLPWTLMNVRGAQCTANPNMKMCFVRHISDGLSVSPVFPQYKEGSSWRGWKHSLSLFSVTSQQQQVMPFPLELLKFIFFFFFPPHTKTQHFHLPRFFCFFLLLQPETFAVTTETHTQNLQDSLQSAGRPRASGRLLPQPRGLVFAQRPQCRTWHVCLPVECLHKPG